MFGNGMPPVYPELAAQIARTGRTLIDVANSAGIHPHTLSHVLRGRTKPSSALRARLAEALGVDDVDWLFQLSPDVERLIQMAVDQGFPRMVSDPDTLRRIVVLTAPTTQ